MYCSRLRFLLRLVQPLGFGSDQRLSQGLGLRVRKNRQCAKRIVGSRIDQALLYLDETRCLFQRLNETLKTSMQRSTSPTLRCYYTPIYQLSSVPRPVLQTSLNPRPFQLLHHTAAGQPGYSLHPDHQSVIHTAIRNLLR
jgi:hypothetical protein